jgi:hypothetical protein
MSAGPLAAEDHSRIVRDQQRHFDRWERGWLRLALGKPALYNRDRGITISPQRLARKDVPGTRCAGRLRLSEWRKLPSSANRQWLSSHIMTQKSRHHWAPPPGPAPIRCRIFW